jgi:aldehyde:ferredoxin oxidoreductase
VKKPKGKKVIPLQAYTGKILHIDVGTGKTKIQTFDESFAKTYIGGTGFGIKTLLDNQPPGIDPLDPQNPLIYALGAVNGTMTPCAASKFGVFAKSPASKLLGEAYSTGQWGAELRQAGYDVLVIKGKAEKPKYIWIDDESVQLMDASHLWGKSTWDTEETIRKDLGDQYIRVSAIGQGGENLSALACLINDHFRAAGRTGLGAVMGSKNLKAVAVRGTHDVSVAEPEKLREYCKDLYERCKGPATSKYRTLGTPANVLSLNKQGALPTRNFREATFEGADKISGEYLNEHYVVKIEACSACPMRCEHIASVPEGPFKGATARIEYEPTMAFGSNCGVDRLDAVIKAVELCNVYGVDAISTGMVIGFAMDLYENGLINSEDTGGLDLRFGNAEAMVEMVPKIALRKDIGAALADGVKVAAEKIGKGSEALACHIKGVELTGYDIRGLKTAALGYMVSRRGADHQRHGAYGPDLGGQVDRFKADKSRGRLVADAEDIYAIFDSIILCKFSRGIWKGYDDIAKLYTIVTGIPMAGAELQLAGERINQLGRIYNIREGLTRADDTVPPRVMNDPIPSGVSKGAHVTKEDVDILLDGYYEARGWTQQGVPKAEKLKDVGLSEYDAMIASKRA